MSSASPTTESNLNPRKAERRQKIIEAAARLFAELGYADCEMERVANELKIAKGTLYLYFPSKESLFFACVDHGMQAMQTAVKVAAEQHTEPFESISAAVRAYLQFFEDHPEQVELLIQERAGFKHRKRPTYFDYRDTSRVRWREVYRKLIEEGRLRKELSVDRILDAVGNMLYGTMFTNHFVGRNVPLDEQHRAIMDIVFRGMWSDAERERPRD